jgi:hypothetical protein
MSEEKETTLGGIFKKWGKKFTKGVDKNLYKLGGLIDANVNPYKQKQVYQEPDYMSIEREFPVNQEKYVYKLSKTLEDKIRNGDIKNSDDLFSFVQTFQKNPKYHQLFSEIFYYIWIGGLRCRYNKLDDKCKGSIANFNKVYQKYKTFFYPFDESKEIEKIMNKDNNFAITLSKTLPSTFVVYYRDPIDKRVYMKRIGPDVNVIQAIEEIQKVYTEKVDRREGQWISNEIKNDRYGRGVPLDDNQMKYIDELKKIVNLPLDDKEYKFLYYWLGLDCEKKTSRKYRECERNLKNFIEAFNKLEKYYEPFFLYDNVSDKVINLQRSTENLDTPLIVILNGGKSGGFIVSYLDHISKRSEIKEYNSENFDLLVNFVKQYITESLPFINEEVKKQKKIKREEEERARKMKPIEEISKRYKTINDMITGTDPRFFYNQNGYTDYNKYLDKLDQELKNIGDPLRRDTIQLYNWLGANCEKDKNYETICQKNIDNLLKLSDIYGNLFGPYKLLKESIQNILENKVPYYILLSDQPGKYLVLQKSGNDIQGNIYDFENLDKIFTKSESTGKKRSYKIPEETKLYENIPRLIGDEEDKYIKKIVKEIFHNEKLDDKKLTWILRWIGMDCPFDDNQICKHRFDVLIKLREGNQELFDHLFDIGDPNLFDQEFDQNYLYLYLSDEVPGEFKYIFYNPIEERFSIGNSSYDDVKDFDQLISYLRGKYKI